jgi:hypothetical protein
MSAAESALHVAVAAAGDVMLLLLLLLCVQALQCVVWSVFLGLHLMPSMAVTLLCTFLTAVWLATITEINH